MAKDALSLVFCHEFLVKTSSSLRTLMQDYRKLEVWQKAHQMTLFVYKVTQSFPTNEQYNLTSQMRRSAYSIPMNIAEGCGKASNPDFARYLDISLGSASELDYQVLLAYDLNRYARIHNV